MGLLLPSKFTLGLAAALGLSLLGNYVQRQTVRRLAAETAPAVQAAKDASAIADDYRIKLQACQDDKRRMGEANAAALLAAQQRAAQAESEAEAYEHRLANPPTGCEAFLQSKICPALLDY